MLAGPLEWFAKRIALESLKRRLFSDDSTGDREIESELYDAFVADYEAIDLTDPTEAQSRLTTDEWPRASREC